MRKDLLLCLLLSIGVRTAFADPTIEESATARTLFEEGRKLMESGDYAGAAAKLEASERLFPGKGIVYNLAVCYEKLGRVASAWSRYMEVSAAAKRMGDAERAEIARENADAIAPRVPHHTIIVTGDSSLIVVARDGLVLAPSTLGAVLPVDPGQHVLVAKADGFQTYTATVDLVEGQSETTRLPALVPIVPIAPPIQPVARVPKEAVRDPKPAIVWTLAIAGATGLATGLVLGAFSIDAYSRSNQYCNANSVCEDKGLDLRNQSIAFGDASTVAFIAGAALGAAALVVWLALPSKKTQTASLPFVSF